MSSTTPRIIDSRSIIGAEFQVNLRAENFTSVDVALIGSFGDPEINLGGTFLGAPQSISDFVLPTDIVKVRADIGGSLGVTQRFSLESDANAKKKALIWADEIVSRIQDAMATLRATVDDFSGESIHTL